MLPAVRNPLTRFLKVQLKYDVLYHSPNGVHVSVPIVIFSVIAGALSDEFGRKPLLILPILGNVLAKITGLINYFFINDLPMEFFYLDNLGSFFGGYAVYYLGTYSYITNVTRPKERAHRLARADGVEVMGTILGTLLSPVIHDYLDYYGSYGFSSAFIFVSLVYCVLFVPEPLVKKQLEDNEEKKSFGTLLWSAVKTPAQGMVSLFTKKRKTSLKLLILLQLACFFVYWLIIEMHILNYLYMRLVFDGFEDQDYAYYSVFNYVCCTVYLMVVVPILNTKVRLHDAVMLLVIVSVEGLYFTIAPFATELWQFYLVSALGSFGLSKYSVVRSLLSKSISMDEVGKVFSILAVTAALAPVAGNPIFRQLYNETMDSFPGAIFLLAAGFVWLTAGANLFLYTQRDKLELEPSSEDVRNQDKSEKIKDTKDKIFIVDGTDHTKF